MENPYYSGQLDIGNPRLIPRHNVLFLGFFFVFITCNYIYVCFKMI